MVRTRAKCSELNLNGQAVKLYILVPTFSEKSNLKFYEKGLFLYLEMKKKMIEMVSFENNFRIKGKLFVIKERSCSESKDAAFLQVLVN